MTNKNKYKQAFSVLHSESNIDLEVLMMKKEKNRKQILKKAGLAVAGFAFLFVASNGIAYAATGSTWVAKIVNFTMADGSNVEIVEENNAISYTIVSDKEKLHDYVSAEEGRLYFVLGDIKEDVTEKCSAQDYYKYEYTDDEGMRHVILVGGTVEDAGWAELIFDKDGTYIFNQMNVSAEMPVWLQKGMQEQGVESGSPVLNDDGITSEEEFSTIEGEQ